MQDSSQLRKGKELKLAPLQFDLEKLDLLLEKKRPSINLQREAMNSSSRFTNGEDRLTDQWTNFPFLEKDNCDNEDQTKREESLETFDFLQMLFENLEMVMNVERQLCFYRERKLCYDDTQMSYMKDLIKNITPTVFDKLKRALRQCEVKYKSGRDRGVIPQMMQPWAENKIAQIRNHIETLEIISDNNAPPDKTDQNFKGICWDYLQLLYDNLELVKGVERELQVQLKRDPFYTERKSTIQKDLVQSIAPLVLSKVKNMLERSVTVYNEGRGRGIIPKRMHPWADNKIAQIQRHLRSLEVLCVEDEINGEEGTAEGILEIIHINFALVEELEELFDVLGKNLARFLDKHKDTTEKTVKLYNRGCQYGIIPYDMRVSAESKMAETINRMDALKVKLDHSSEEKTKLINRKGCTADMDGIQQEKRSHHPSYQSSEATITPTSKSPLGLCNISPPIKQFQDCKCDLL